ncbi:MAG TPA: TIGR02206 family membrane protein [Rhodothermales bacterium]|nr:TIGR02206 family membrane protein [Rhodothermales bacterium]HRR10324.1 TIGR02206 family membrane protein [Rhodothermales bacterium]
MTTETSPPFIWYGPYHLTALGLTLSLLLIIGFVAKHYRTPVQQRRIALFLALAFIGFYGWITILEVRGGFWSLAEGLPFHLCDISAITLSYAAITRRFWAFEAGYYWGLGGGLAGLLMPELPYEDIYAAPFFFWHALLVATPCYLVLAYGLRPTFGGIFRTLGITALLALPIGLAVWLIPNANYMFLGHAPIAAEALGMPSWPYYIPYIGLLGLVLFSILYAPFWIMARLQRKHGQ